MIRECRILEHTADVGLEASADSLAELFQATAEGMCDIVIAREGVRRKQKTKLTVTADDAESLLVDFLSELNTMLQSEGLAVAGVTVVDADEHHVSAEIEGEPFDPDRHETGMEIKAVTFHQIKVARQDGCWFARVIFDV